MLKKVDGRNYVILDDGSRFPYLVRKAAVDKTINKLEGSLQEVIEGLKEVESGKVENLSLFIDNNMTFVDIVEEIWRLERMLESLQTIKNKLSGEDDEIPKQEDLMTLSDYGFRSCLYSRNGEDGFWEKIIQDTEEKEVALEILWKSPDEEPLYRERTIIWKRDSEHSRSSDTITYKNLNLGKKLRKAVEKERKGMANKNGPA